MHVYALGFNIQLHNKQWLYGNGICFVRLNKITVPEFNGSNINDYTIYTCKGCYVFF